ncbi:MAG: hypothetical protein JKY65_02575 [Planctomycetes bacterium]|nr:hypothetical protein [Planctomycetota bacterium]
MSVEFSLNGSSLTLEAWDALVEESNDWDLNDHSDPVFSESGGAQFLVPGSTRGVLLSHEGTPSSISFRLGALASQADWRAAYALVTRALAGGGGTFEREDGTTLSAEALTADLANEHALTDFVSSVEMLGQVLTGSGDDAEEVALPLGRFSLRLTPADLPDACGPEEAQALEATLAARVDRYSRAFHASTLYLEGGIRVSTWALIETLVGSGAHLIACSAFDPEAGLIPADQLLEVLGDLGESTGGGGLFLPELDLEKDPALRGKLEAILVQPEAWAEANSERLDSEAEATAESAAESAAEFEPYRGLLTYVLAESARGLEPAEIHAALQERGVPEEVAGNVVGLIGIAFEHIYTEEGEVREDPGAVLEDLVQAGVPPGLGMLVLEVIARGPPEEAEE